MQSITRRRSGWGLLQHAACTVQHAHLLPCLHPNCYRSKLLQIQTAGTITPCLQPTAYQIRLKEGTVLCICAKAFHLGWRVPRLHLQTSVAPPLHSPAHSGVFSTLRTLGWAHG
jgi:hypothetical protein